MNRKLIVQYISKLNKSDIYNFSLRNGINLNNEEVNVIYDYITTRYDDFLSGNSENILEELKQRINSDAYNKIMKLYSKYENKIK